MLEPLSIGAVLLIEATLLFEALIDCGALVYAFASAAAAIGLFVATSQANAETPYTFIDAQEVIARSDDRVQLIGSSGLIKPLDYHLPKFAFSDNVQILPVQYQLLAQKPGSTSTEDLPTLPAPSNFGATAPANPVPATAVAPANQGPPTADARVNRLPPPAEALVKPLPPPAEPLVNPTPPATEAPAGVNQPALVTPMTEFEEELKKNEEETEKEEAAKPVIPDLAKGILIASNDGDLTFKPGLRMTPRYNHESTNGNNDMFIRRFRLKGSGSAFGVAKYGAEIKIDNPGRFEVTPTAVVENAWLDFPVVENELYFRAGRFDIPMSRNELTSDSKLLLMDRTLIKEALTAVGMADKQYGVMLHGRPDCGRWEYDVGIFDSNVYEKLSPADTRETDQLMPAARVVHSFLDPPTALDGYMDYWESYIGKGQRLDVAFNTAYLGGITDGLREFNQTGLGTDLFFNTGPYTFQAEYDWIFQNSENATPDALIHGWYAQWGYLIDYWCEKPCREFAVRYQTLDSELLPETVHWTSVGFNFYIREHNLKVQTDYTFRQGDSGTLFTMMQEDVFQIQLQLDF
jgi:hypothetical protein